MIFISVQLSLTKYWISIKKGGVVEGEWERKWEKWQCTHLKVTLLKYKFDLTEFFHQNYFVSGILILCNTLETRCILSFKVLLPFKDHSWSWNWWNCRTSQVILGICKRKYIHKSKGLEVIYMKRLKNDPLPVKIQICIC